MSKALKYYYDLLSQPSRSLWIALKLCNVKYEDYPVALKKREQLTDEYKQINRFQKVPCIVDGNFHLSESVAILRYLVDKGHLADRLYPKLLEKRARVDEFLEWQHLSVRLNCGSYFRNSWLLPKYGLAPPLTPEREAKMVKEVESTLELIERIWLSKSAYVAGEEFTAADLFGACEIEQIRLCKYNIKAKKFPKVSEWLERVRKDSNPYFDEAHKFIYEKSKEATAVKN